MSKLAKALTVLQFGRALIEPLGDFIAALHRRTNGNVQMAAGLLRKIHADWDDYDGEVAKINAELERLKAEGK